MTVKIRCYLNLYQANIKYVKLKILALDNLFPKTSTGWSSPATCFDKRYYSFGSQFHDTFFKS